VKQQYDTKKLRERAKRARETSRQARVILESLNNTRFREPAGVSEENLVLDRELNWRYGHEMRELSALTPDTQSLYRAVSKLIETTRECTDSVRVWGENRSELLTNVAAEAEKLDKKHSERSS
jgi:hypothetical protein